jgi:hypothetical protein
MANRTLKREPVSDIDTAAVDNLKALDLKRPIREGAISANSIPLVLLAKNTIKSHSIFLAFPFACWARAK